MSCPPFWPGQSIQTLSINGDILSINPGNSVTLPGGGGGGQDWSQFPALQDVNMANNRLTDLNSITSQGNFIIQTPGDITLSSESGIVSIPGNLVVSSINNLPINDVISTFNTASISSLNVSSINGLPYTPGITSTISTFNQLYTSSLNANSITTETFTAISTVNVISTISTGQIQTDNIIASSINTSSIQAQDININFNFNANVTTTSTLNVINTTNLSNVNATSISTVNLTTTGNTIFTDAYAGTLTVGEELSVGSNINMTGSGGYLEVGENSIRVLAPTIGYNDVYLEANLKVGDPGALSGPDIELYPNEFTMGDALHPISGGISMTAGTTISLYSPLINMLGANVAVGAGNIVIGSGAVEIGSGNITIGTATTPGGGMNVYGGKIFAGPSVLGPPSGNGGIVVQDESDLQTNAIRNGNLGYLLIESQTPGTNNISINDISQLTSDGAGMLQQNVGRIIGNASNFAITNVSSINGSAYPPSFAVPTNLEISTLKVNNGEGTFFTDGTGTITSVSTSVGIANALFQQDANQSTIQRFAQVMNPVSGGNGDVYFTYDVTPVGFPSTTMGQIIFSSTINGGSGGVKITSQFGDAKQLAVNGSGVFASDLIVGSNSDYPILVQTPDLDEWVLLGLSTLGGGVGKCEIINTTTANTGQLTFSAPNVSTGTSSRIMVLDSSNAAVGINNSAPQAPLDVGGLNYASAGSVGIFGGDKDGTLEVTLQNKSAGSNASAFFFAVENTGGEYAGFGQNSLNLSSIYNTLFELPGSAVVSGTLDLVMGPQSDHSSNSGVYLTYQDGAFAHHINSNGALSFNASYNGTVNEGNFGTSNSILQTNGSGAAPVWANSVSLTSANVSTLNTQTINLTTPSFVAPVALINTTNGGKLVEVYDNLGTPAGYITTITAIDTNPALQGKAFINMVNSISSIGICKTPDTGVTLDVEGIARAKVWEASTVQTSQVFSPTSFVNVQSGTGVVSLTPAPGWFAEVNSGVVAGDQQGLIKFGQSEINITGYNGGENYIANQLYPGSYDSGWTNYVGRAVRVEYPILLDSSFPSGNGQAQFVLPVGFSTLGSFQASYVGFQDTNPAFNHPAWLYSTITDGSGLISTIQVGGEAATTVFVSVVGYV